MPDTLRNTQTFLVPSIGRDNGSEHWRLDSEETMRLGVFVCVCVVFFVQTGKMYLLVVQPKEKYGA